LPDYRWIDGGFMRDYDGIIAEHHGETIPQRHEMIPEIGKHLPTKLPSSWLNPAVLTLSVFLMIAGATRSLWALSEPTPQKADSSACSTIDLNFDDKSDVHAIEKYEAALQKLLAQEKFDELECIADSDRSTKAKFSGGMWKLHNFYGGIQEPRGHATEEDWSTHLARLNRWVAAKPASITARVALASAYIQYAWAARGEDFADKVTASGARLFDRRTQKARQILEQASSLQAKCPEWYLAMQFVALGQGWEKAKAESLLNQAIAFEPDYHYYYRAYANFLSPSWYGEDGDPEQFIQQASDRMGGVKGDILYFRVATFMVRNVPGINVQRLSWPRIQKGFAESEKQDGVSLTNLNWLAYFAEYAQDAIVADNTFTRIGDNWDEEVWGTKDHFDSSKAAAANWAPQVLWQKQAEDSAEANMQTEEGRYMAKQFQVKYADAIQECSHSSASKPATFDLIVCVLQDGNFSWIRETKGPDQDWVSCLMKKVYGRAIVPPPYHPYWIIVESKSSATAVAPAR
jgi:hypothetical protein